VIALELSAENEVEALGEELRALGANPLIQQGSSSDIVHLVETDLQMVARALDHLRNRGGTSPEIHSARDRLLMQLQIPPLTYRLRSWQFDWKDQDKAFWSYTGPYAKGDRLVTFGGHEFTVFDVLQEATNTQDGALIVVRA
jgi:hypothetical protein